MKFKIHIVSSILITAIASMSLSQILFDKPTPQFALLAHSKIKLELALTIDQELKLAQILAPVTVEFQGRKVFQLGPTADALDRLEAEVEAALIATQRRRLREIWIQKQGSFTLLDSGIAKELAVSKPQSEKIKKIATELSDKMMAPKPMRMDTKVLQEYKDRILKELTPAQNVRFMRMQGAKFLD